MNENNTQQSEQNEKTIIIGEADTQTLRQMADKPAGKKRMVRQKKTLDSINKNAKWYPFRVAWFVISKALSYALNALLTVMLICAVTGIAVACAFLIYIRNFVDLEYTGLDNLKFTSDQATQIVWVDEEGNEHELEDDRLHGSENRLWVNYSDIPQTLIDAYVSIEDQRFWNHKGVDAKRTFSAIFNFFIPTSSNYGGGSTLTQQLIKNVSGEN
ncbi:MAG: transglycosylase domain-containing protein, partial [Clostridia bacterium]|nr:transglycosylase domain-containing protein [Clostridia bacterium]